MNRVSTGELARINQAMAKAGADAVKKRKEQEEQRKKYEEERQKAALEQSRIPNGGGSAWEQYRAAKAAGEVKNASEFIQKRDARNSAWNKIGVDTLEDDMKALSNSIGAAYGDTLDTSKYYTQEQLNASSNQVKQVRDRLQALQDYYNTYGGTDEQKKAVGDQIKAYDDEIQFFGDLANHYGSYKNEADFNYRNDKRLNENYLTYNYDINAGKTKLKDIESYLDVINGRNAGATHAAYERAKKQYGLDGMSASEIKNWLTQEYQLESFAVNNADRMRTAAGYKSLANSSDFTQGVLSGKATENPTFEDINAYQTELEQLSDKMTGRVGGGFTKEDEERYNYLKEHPVTINNKLRFYDDYNNGNGEYHASPLPAGATDYSGLDNDIKYAVNGNRDLLTDEEASTYYYLLGTKGADAANEYLDYMQTTLDFRNTEQVKQAIEEFKNNKHFRDISTAILNPATYLTHAVGITSDKDYEKVKDNTVNAIYSAISVPMNVIGGGIATIGDVSQRLSLISKGDWDGEGYNPYANYNLLAVSGQQARGLVAKDIEENTSLTLFGQNICSQLYQSLMSGADSAFGMASLGKMYTVSMYGSAATSKAAELYESGASNSQIFYESMLSGIAEMTFEYLSLENLSSIKNVMEASPTTLKKAVKMILVQNGVEASEEVFTEIANTVIDEGIRKYDSDYNQKITEYVRDGMSRDEAVKKAAGEVASNITWAGIGGAFSGLASSSLTIMGSYSANKEMRNQQYSAIDPGTADGLVTNAKNIDLAILNDVSAAIKSGDTERAQEIISEGKDWYDSLKAYGKDKYGKTQGSEISASVDASIDNLNKISKLVAEGKIEASAIDGILANAKTSAETKDVVSENNEKLYSVLAKENISNKDIERNILKDKGTLAAFERLTGLRIGGTTVSQKRADVREAFRAVSSSTETLKAAQNAIESGATATEGHKNAAVIIDQAIQANRAENSRLRNSEKVKSAETKAAIDATNRQHRFLETVRNYVINGGDLSGFTESPVANVSGEGGTNSSETKTTQETAKNRVRADFSAYQDEITATEYNKAVKGSAAEQYTYFSNEEKKLNSDIKNIAESEAMTAEEKAEAIEKKNEEKNRLYALAKSTENVREMMRVKYAGNVDRLVEELQPRLKKYGIKIDVVDNIDAAGKSSSGAYFDRNTNTIKVSRNWDNFNNVVKLVLTGDGLAVTDRASVSFDRAVTQTIAHEIAHADSGLTLDFIKAVAGTQYDAFDLKGRLEHPDDRSWRSEDAQKEKNWRRYVDAYTEQAMLEMKGTEEQRRASAEKVVNDAYIFEEIMADMFGAAVDDMGHSSKAGENIFWAMNRNKPGIIKRILNALERFIARIRGKDAYLAVEQRQAAERLRDMLTGELKRAYGTDVKGEAAVESGEGKRHSLAGANSRTADLNSLGGAYQMYQNGVSMDTIRKRTGWWLGKDGKWRYEISDKEMRFNPEGYVDNPQTVGDYVKHDRLFAAYPWIADIPVYVSDVVGGDPSSLGRYIPSEKIIEIKAGITSEKARTVLAHELQHVIQNTEHFASGTNTVVATRYLINLAYDLVKNNPEFVAKKKPQDKMDYIIGYIEAKDNTTLDEYARYYYFRNHGETEARNTAKRLDMTDAERKAIPVVNDGDVYTRESVRSEFIDNLREMGYNKKQIDTIMKEGVSYDNKSEDEQKSLGQVGKRGGNLGRTVDGLLSQNLQRGTQREVHGNGEVQEVDSAEKAGQIGSVSGGVSRRTDSGASGLGEAGKRLNEVSKPEKRFSLSSNVEQTKDLIAVHNMTAAELEKSLDLGGLPMPSIAIIKAADGHSEYGDVSLVFGKDTIDPKKSARNKVYGGDAWTPTFPKIDYKANEKVGKRIRDKYYALSRKYGYDNTRALYNYAQDLSDVLTSEGGEKAMIDRLYGDTGMMQIYLMDTGRERVANVNKETKTALTDGQVRQYENLIDTLGRDKMNGFAKKDGEELSDLVRRRKAFIEENEAGIRKAFEKTFIEDGMSAKDAAEVSAELALSDLRKYVLDTFNYIKNGAETVKTEFDSEATNAAIKKAADGEGYRKWVNDLFGGAEEKSGIRNSKDAYTASGNRRSFEALHWENNLENIVKAMLEQDETGGAFFSGTGIWGVSAKKYNSISDIKNDSSRLRTMNEAEYNALKEQYGARMQEIAQTLIDPKNDNYFIASDDAYSLIVDAVRNSKDESGILRYLKKYNSRATEKTASDIAALVRDIAEMPTGYFEAKPQRAVGFDEVKAVILPDNASGELVSRLESDGINTVTYKAGDENSRLEALNGVENVRFSLARANDEYMKAVESGNVEEQQRLVDEAAENAGYNVRAWHGTKNRFTKFRLPIDELGVHFGTKSQARTFAGRGKNAVMQNDILSVHNPIKLGRDLGSWYPGDVARELYGNGILSKEETESILFTDDKRYRRQDSTAVKMLRELLTQKGYDAIIYPNYFEGKTVKDSYLIWDKENVKSADPITYDDSGNVIPLTERFDSGNRDIRWSLAGTNKDGIEVYETSYNIKNLTNKERMKRFEDIMKDDYRGRTAKFIRNGHAYYATFEDTDVKKNIYGDRQSSAGGWKAKIRAGADGDIFELVENAEYDRSSAEQGKSNSAHKGINFWDYYVKTVQIDNEVYDLLANVRRNGDDSYVYNIRLYQNKKIKASPPIGIQTNSVKSGAQRSDNSVSQNDPVVNTQSMQSIEKDSSDERHSLVKSAQGETETIEAEDKAIKNVLEKFSKERYYKSGYPYKFNEFLNRIADLSETSGERIPREQLLDTVKRLFRYAYENRLDGKALGRDYRHDTDILAAMVGDIENDIYDWVSPLRDEYNEARDVKKKLRTEKIFVPTEIRASVAESAGFETWSDFRKSLFGIVGLVNEQKGRALSDVYAELSEIYPEYFPDNITDGTEQAVLIADLARNMRVNGIGESNVLSYEEQLVKKSIGRAISELLYNGENTVSINAMRKRIAQLKEQREKAITSLKEKYAEQFKNRSEKQKQTVLRNKVLRKYTEASSMLDRPTTENHFTEAMRKPLMEFLAAVDITTGKSVAKQATYDRVLRIIEEAKNTTAEGDKNGLDIAETDLNVQEKQLIVDSGLLERMSAWIKANQGKKLTELSSAELEELNGIFNQLNHLTAEIKRLYDPREGLAAKSWQAQKEIGLAQTKERKQVLGAKTERARGTYEQVHFGALDPSGYYNTLGSDTMTAQFERFRRCQNRFSENIQMFTDRLGEIVDGAIPKDEHGKNAKEVTLKLSHGTLTATPAQLMSIHLMLNQEDSRRCLFNEAGGVIIGKFTAEKPKDGKAHIAGKRTFAQSGRLVLNEADAAKITAALTDGQRKRADAISALLNNEAARLGNEVSMAMYGYKKYTTENYFPMRTADDYRAIADNPNYEMNLLGLSFTKERTGRAGKALVAEDIYDVIGRHLTNMAQYNAFAQELDNAKKMYSLRLGDGTSLKQRIIHSYGREADAFYNKLINNLSGVQMYTNNSAEALSDKLLSNYKAAAVAGNVSVVLKQPMSIFRALPEFSLAGLKKSMAFEDILNLSPKQLKANTAEMLKYSGIARLKAWGSSENMTRKSFESLYNDNSDTVRQKINEFLTSGAENADMWTWAKLWRMSKAEIDAQGKYTAGSKEYFEAVDRKFSDVIGKTQVVQSALDSSMAVQNAKGFGKFLFAFQNEPLKQYSYLISTLNDARRGKPGAKKKLAKVIASSLANTAAVSAISTFMAWLRGTLDRDDDDELLDDLMKEFAGNSIDDLLSGAFAPVWQYIDTIMGAINSGVYGNTVERLDMAALTDLGGLINKYFISQNGGRPNLGTVQDIVNVASNLFGLPAKNIFRDVKSVIDRIILELPVPSAAKYNYLKAWKDVELTNKAAVTEAYYDVLRDAVDRGRYSDYVKIKRDMIYHGYTETKIKNAVMKSSLMDDLYELKKVNPGSYKAKVNSIVSSVSAVSSLEGKEFEDFIESAMKRREREDGGSKTDDEVYDEMHRKMEKEVKEQLIYIDVSKRAAYIKKMLKTYGEYGITEADILKVLRKAGKA